MKTIQLTQTDNGKRVQARVGDVIEIALSENPTTGYRWAVAATNAAVLTVKSSDFSSARDAKIGSGGMRKVIFVAAHAGDSPIELKLWREWLGDASIIERFEVQVHVDESI